MYLIKPELFIKNVDKLTEYILLLWGGKYKAGKAKNGKWKMVLTI